MATYLAKWIRKGKRVQATGGNDAGPRDRVLGRYRQQAERRDDSVLAPIFGINS
jgi:hypothetical protein